MKLFCFPNKFKKDDLVISLIGNKLGKRVKICMESQGMSWEEALSLPNVKFPYSTPGQVFTRKEVVTTMKTMLKQMKNTRPDADGMWSLPAGATTGKLLSILKSVIVDPSIMSINNALRTLGQISRTTTGTIVTYEILDEVFVHLIAKGIKIIVFVGDGTGFWGYAIGMVLNAIARKNNEDPFLVFVTDPQNFCDSHYAGLTKGVSPNDVTVLKFTAKDAIRVFGNLDGNVAMFQVRPTYEVDMEYREIIDLVGIVVIVGELPDVGGTYVQHLSDFYNDGYKVLGKKFGDQNVIAPPIPSA